VEVNTCENIINHPEQEYTRQLIASRVTPAPRTVTSATTSRESLLRLDNIDARYGGFHAVKDLSLEFARGETTAIVGESGSGKSTLARVISGLKSPSAGQMTFEGKNLPLDLARRPKDLLRRIQLIFQTPDVAVNPKQRVADIVGRPLSFYFRLKGKALDARVDELLALVELPPSLRGRYPSELSGGQKQRVCIARALAAEPDLIICDEITSALDQLVADGILNSLEKLQQKLGLSCIFITHDLSTVMRIAHRVAVMQEGRVVASGSIEEVFLPPRLPYTQDLLSAMPEMRIGWLDDIWEQRQSKIQAA
jgi:peptide/nickel transport system ATP-binding protein